ncbi:restriction endonuclease subunit S [Bacteroidia bacterium]|nr:restriction endonuclease subunit S [Bacteroidia bacterium]
MFFFQKKKRKKKKNITMKEKNSINVPNLRFAGFGGEWESTQLSLLGDFIGGGTPASSNSDFWQGDVPWVSSSDLFENDVRTVNITRYITQESIVNSATKLCSAPVVLIVSRVGVGKVAYSKTSICTSQDFTNITNLKCNGLFLSYFLSNVMKKKATETQGTSIKGITSAEIKSIKLFMPVNKEQHKIASFLSLIDERIETQIKIIEELKVLKIGLSKQIFSNQKHTQSVRLGDLCCITTGKLDANAMVENGLYKFFTCAEEIYQIDNYAFDTEALLISGNGANLGYIHYYNGKFNAYQRTYVLDSFQCNIHYVKYYLQTNLHKRIEQEKNTGNTPYIVLSTLSDMIIKLPTTEEQTKTTNILTLMDTKLKRTERLLNLYLNLKQYLLQQMFI